MSAVTRKPDPDQEEVRHWLREHFSLDGSLDPLPGERDLNLKLTTASGEAYVCKISGALDEFELLAAQNDVLIFLEDRNMASIPKVLVSRDGESLLSLDLGGQTCLGRILSYVPGKVLAKCTPYRHPLLRHLGRTMADLNEALEGYDHPAFHYKFDWDLAHAAEVVERHRELIADPGQRDRVDQIHEDFAEMVVPRFDQLRMGVIHNDANDYNLLAVGDRVTGLIDFGDMVHSHGVCDLAVTIAYATLDADDILPVIRELVIGYHESRPLDAAELAVLFPMARMRLALSACMAAHQVRLRPDDPYLEISQEPIRRTLPRLLELDTDHVLQTLRKSLA